MSVRFTPGCSLNIPRSLSCLVAFSQTGWSTWWASAWASLCHLPGHALMGQENPLNTCLHMDETEIATRFSQPWCLKWTRLSSWVACIGRGSCILVVLTPWGFAARSFTWGSTIPANLLQTFQAVSLSHTLHLDVRRTQMFTRLVGTCHVCFIGVK